MSLHARRIELAELIDSDRLTLEEARAELERRRAAELEPEPEQLTLESVHTTEPADPAAPPERRPAP